MGTGATSGARVPGEPPLRVPSPRFHPEPARAQRSGKPRADEVDTGPPALTVPGPEAGSRGRRCRRFGPDTPGRNCRHRGRRAGSSRLRTGGGARGHSPGRHRPHLPTCGAPPPPPAAARAHPPRAQRDVAGRAGEGAARRPGPPGAPAPAPGRRAAPGGGGGRARRPTWEGALRARRGDPRRRGAAGRAAGRAAGPEPPGPGPSRPRSHGSARKCEAEAEAARAANGGGREGWAQRREAEPGRAAGPLSGPRGCNPPPARRTPDSGPAEASRAACRERRGATRRAGLRAVVSVPGPECRAGQRDGTFVPCSPLGLGSTVTCGTPRVAFADSPNARFPSLPSTPSLNLHLLFPRSAIPNHFLFIWLMVSLPP